MRVALVLAAGASRRFGARDKLAARIAGRSLLDHSIDRARESGVPRILLVRRTPGRSLGTIVHVRARDAGSGIGASLIAGLARLRPIDREVLIFLADAPFAGAGRALRLKPGGDAVRPFHSGEPGHPMLVRVAVARRLARSIDRGIAGAIAPDRLARVVGREAAVLDIDSPATLRRLRYRIAAAGGAFRLRNGGPR